ncbi:MAG: transglutaminase domain-containing protein [Phycisphaerales bacterium]|nr:MAG: transglutaminase domain-containing protein [Phycisphaerales bacterium]
MKTQKVIAILMMLSSSVMTTWVSGDIAYPAILCMLGLLGLQRRLTWDIRPERRVIKSLLMLLLAIAFALHYRYARVPNEQAVVFAWQTIARYFLASMILMLFLGRPGRLPSSLGFFHVAITISAGQVLLLDGMRVPFRLSELISVILLVLYATTARTSNDTLAAERVGRTSRRLASGLILVAAVNCGWITSSILYANVETLYLPGWFWRGSIALGGAPDGVPHVGFSRSGKLSSVLSIKGDQDTTPVLRITCEESPGYLRARAFDVYRQSEWYDLSAAEEILPDQSRPFGMYFVGRTNVFRLDERDAAECNYMTIRHEFRFANEAFTPLGTSFLGAQLNLLLRDDDDIVYTRNSRSGLKYRIGYNQSTHQKRPAGIVRRMLNIPVQLDPRVRRLASGIFAGRSTTTEKIDAVVNYFQTNYTYQLGLEVPAGRDKLTYFLLEGSTGYCEYFASGAVMLLRLAGVPTRYVTGFLVTEKDAETTSWIARNMDAHAWAEAWDQERNEWTIVEATPQEGPAMASAAEQLEDTSGGTTTILRQLLKALYRYGLFGLLSWLFMSRGLLGSSLALAVFGGATLFLILCWRRNHKKSKGQTQTRTARDPGLVILHKALARMDRKVAAAGSRRDFAETLHAFSKRLRVRDSGDGLWTRISNWYLEYADLRYRRTVSTERLQRLQQLADGLRDSL